MRIQTTTFMIGLAAGAALASAQEPPTACPEWAIRPCAAVPHREPARVWDPNLAQWRVEHPRRVWDPNLAQYRFESRHEVWDPYLAQYRPRDARRDPPPPSRQADGRHRHAGRQEWCSARH